MIDTHESHCRSQGEFRRTKSVMANTIVVGDSQILRMKCFRYNLQIARDNNSSDRVSVSAPLAQLDRASGYEPEGREFESLRAHHFIK